MSGRGALYSRYSTSDTSTTDSCLQIYSSALRRGQGSLLPLTVVKMVSKIQAEASKPAKPLEQLDNAPTYYVELETLHNSSKKLNDGIAHPTHAPEFDVFSTISGHAHYLTLFKDEEKKSLVAVISLRKAKYKVIDRSTHTFAVETVDGTIVYCRAPSEYLLGNWMRKLTSLNVVNSVTADCVMPEELPVDKLKKRCSFTDQAQIGEEFEGGPLRDVIMYVLIHSSTEQDNLMLTGLIVTLQEKNNYTMFMEAFKQVLDSLFGDRRGGKTDKAWRNRLAHFTVQFCRAYRFFTAAERERFCETTASILKMPLNLGRTYASISDSIPEVIIIRPMLVTPRWGQSHLRLRDMSTTHIAEQLTYFEAQLHHQIDVMELIDGSGATVSSATVWWNKIASWTSYCVLREPNVKAQYEMYKLFVKVADCLMRMRNYSGCSQVLSGLNHPSVERLKSLQKLISDRVSHKLVELNQFNPMHNYADYRSLSFESPCLRFLAVHQRDLRFICDANPMFLDKAKTLINAQRMKMTGECIHKIGLDYPAKSFFYEIDSDKHLQDYLSQVKTITDDELFALSFTTERLRETRSSSDAELSPSGNTEVTTSSNPLHKSESLSKMYKKEPTIPVTV